MSEKVEYLQEQLITYIGNKRALLPFIGQGVELVQNSLKKQQLHCLDVFAGSGIVGRFLKQYSSSITVNDLENYSYIINDCYLSNPSDEELSEIKKIHQSLSEKIEAQMMQIQTARENGTYKHPGFISELYSPADSNNITKEDRCFYTNYNANFLDVARQLIETEVPEKYKKYFIAPLLSQASIHANTAGIFKGFYKNSKTKTGQFGGNGKNALSRILGEIVLEMPVLSENKCNYRVFCKNANELVTMSELYDLPQDAEGIFDLAYFDPPYNQHPYGSNYFMLNLIANYERPDVEKISRVSGIPKNWNRSIYNKKNKIADEFFNLVNTVRAKFVLVSFNSEGFISKDEMVELLSKCGKVTVLESEYNTFRGSRNLKAREIHVKEYLFLVEKNYGKN